MGEAWIGFTDTTTEGTFAWSNPESKKYTNWNNNEPNDSGGNEDCAALHKSGVWNDISCSQERTFICEFRKCYLFHFYYILIIFIMHTFLIEKNGM